MKTILHWFRRDLRLADNTALNAAFHEAGGGVIPVFIQSEWRKAHRWAGAARQDALCQSLAALDHAIANAGGKLVFRRGDAVDELEKLLAETKAEAIYYNRDPDPYGRETEKRLEAMAKRRGVRAVGFQDITVREPMAVLTGAGKPFRVFTPYSRAWLKEAIPTPGATLQHGLKPHNLFSLPVPTLADWNLTRSAEILPSGEVEAKKRMEAFFAGPIFRYAEERDFPAAEATSRFSLDLRWGTISIRELVAQCRTAADKAESAAGRKSAQIFLNELIWREFYLGVLWHWPEVLEHEFQPQFRGMPWLYPGRKPVGVLRDSDADPEEAFRRWKEGTTGFPIVDAGMRQLAATGFMHNRVRMITAMFLTKDLHLDWRLGEQHFMQSLADGEIGSNNGGWQWSAGTGADAAPYFRIQNPWTQSANYDPDGAYIKEWVPELRDLHPATFRKAPLPGTRLTKAYPPPIVDHAKERAITLELFKDVAAAAAVR